MILGVKLRNVPCSWLSMALPPKRLEPCNASGVVANASAAPPPWRPPRPPWWATPPRPPRTTAASGSVAAGTLLHHEVGPSPRPTATRHLRYPVDRRSRILDPCRVERFRLGVPGGLEFERTHIFLGKILLVYI